MTFEEFWQLYPKKVGKLDAARRWAHLRPDASLCAQIAATLGWQIPLWSGHEQRFTPNPATWLNQGRWLDERPSIERTLLPPTAAERQRIDRTLHAWGNCRHQPTCTTTAQCRALLLARFRGEE